MESNNADPHRLVEAIIAAIHSQPTLSDRASSSISSGYRESRSKVTIEPKPCIVCLEPPPANGMFEALPCSHRLCIPCLQKYVRFKLQAKQIPIPCVQSRCPETLTLEACKPFLPWKLSDAWEILLVEHHIPQGERVYCPFPNCSALLIKDISGKSINTSVECPSCNRLFCVSCMVPWHAHLTCSEYQKLPPDERSREDVLLQGLAKEKKWSRCSKCKHYIELRQGCNHITCRCGNQFCYICGAKWKSNSHTCKENSRS